MKNNFNIDLLPSHIALPIDPKTVIVFIYLANPLTLYRFTAEAEVFPSTNCKPITAAIIYRPQGI